MAREDLITALKNGVDRGESLDAAKISLVTAGYGIEDVEEAAQEVEVHPELSSKAPMAPSSMPRPSKILSEAPSPGQKKTGKVEREKTENDKSEGPKWMNYLIPMFIVVMVLLIISLLYFYVIKKPVA